MTPRGDEGCRISVRCRACTFATRGPSDRAAKDCNPTALVESLGRWKFRLPRDPNTSRRVGDMPLLEQQDHL